MGVRGKLLALLLAVVWLAFLTILGARAVSATPLHQAIAADTDTPTSVPTNTPTTAPPTSTPKHTATPTSQASPTETGSTTATVAPTATTDTGGSGDGGNPNDPGGGSSQATKVALAQPTYASGADTSQQGISAASFGSSGLIFASVISCVVGLLGIIVAVIAVQILRRDGYGPFLRALFLGKRANRAAKAKGAVAPYAAGGVRRAGWSAGDRDEYTGEDDSVSEYGRAAPPSSSRRGPPPRGAQAPRQRSSRPDW